MSKFCKWAGNNKYFLIFILLYILVRLVIFNANYTEWGDTFRMIRGAEYLSNLSWPWDEKRWPFYSLLLIPGIWFQAPVIWGRLLSLVLSVGILTLIYLFYLRFISDNKKYAVLAVVITATSSVFAYWSIRVMADSLFVFLILLFGYVFMSFYGDKKSPNLKTKLFLTVILLMLTMTRLEGVFMAVSTGLYLLINKKWKDVFIFFIPQALIYVPWTLYAKVIYSGPVQNDYLNEVQGFVFNFERFVYFFTYTTFLLVIPILLYFLLKGFRNLYSQQKQNWKVWIPLGGFIALEIIIGFIWTPSLPRIYMPIIPFMVVLTVLGIEHFQINLKTAKEKRFLFIGMNLLFIFMFMYLQYTQRLYFLGASKVLFGIIIFANIILIATAFLPKHGKSILITGIIFTNLVISGVVIHNQRFVYRTVKDAIDFSLSLEDKVAYADETGNTEWYVRNNSYYLPSSVELNAPNQYNELKNNDVKLLIWTNEFNRGSMFVRPVEGDDNYELIMIYSQPIQDPFEILFEQFGIQSNSDYTVFESEVYRVNY